MLGNWGNFVSRRKSRILAFQALYSWDASNEPIESLLQFSWVESKDSMEGEAFDFARLLISGTIENIDLIDDKIKTNLSQNWNFDRLNKVTLAILRISIYSLLFQKEIPGTIVIDEAISISKDYGLDDSFKFVNAILDKISKEQK